LGGATAPARNKEGFRHTGYLGIGIHRDYRGKGIGENLLIHTVRAGFKGTLTRIELDVFATNSAAINLYQKYGFKLEGRKRQARIIDNIAEDILIMSLLKEEFRG
jgi:RimJ/RimL family protein N-acetyltransferase